MNTQFTYHHAIVIGSSIAGLTAARVLTDHCERVSIIERDIAPTAKEFRKGVPQARHPHILLKGGEQVLENLFPGLRQCCSTTARFRSTWATIWTGSCSGSGARNSHHPSTMSLAAVHYLSLLCMLA